LLTRYPTSAVVPFTLLVPVVGIVTAWAVQGEQPVTTELVGGAIMLLGLAAAVWQPWRRSSAPLTRPKAFRGSSLVHDTFE
jgi:O-acetylserine/cysteine efflux transporter